MLIDVEDDKAFQHYLDRMEQRLHTRIVPVLSAGMRLQMSRGGIPAAQYVNERGAPILLKHYLQIYRDSFSTVPEKTEKAVTRVSKVVDFLAKNESYLRRYAERSISGVSQSQSDEIRDRVLAGLRANKTAEQIARELVKAIPDLSRSRAATIARTETHNVAMAALDASMQAKGIAIESKTWWTASDSKVRETHRAVHGVSVPYTEPFTVGGSQMMYPGDQSLGAGAEEIVNCRCTVLFKTQGVRIQRRPAEEIGTDADAAARKAKEYVLYNGIADQVEHLRWVDLRTGQLQADKNSGTKGNVQFTDLLVKAMLDPNSRVEVHHNHPSDSSFSKQDLLVVAEYPGLSRLWAHGHQGSSYLTTAVRKGIGPAFDEQRKYEGAALQAFADDVRTGKVPASMYSRVFGHAQLTSLKESGWVTYEAKLAPDLRSYISENQKHFDGLVKNLKIIANRHDKKAAGIPRGVPPAFIDPPGKGASLQEWIDYLAELEESDIPGLGPMKREARREIDRLKKEQS